MKQYLYAAIMIIVTGAAPNAMAADIPESTDPIRLAINEWSGQHITTKVAGKLLEKMGYSVEYITAGYYPMLTAIQEGELAAGLEVWHGNISENYFDMVKSGELEEFGEVGIDGGAFWMYPAYMEAQCPGLPNWEALKDCAQLFATAETFPSGRFVEYPADWGDTGNPERLEALGLDFTTISAGSEGALVAEIRAAFARQAPLLIMFWRPHWIHSEVELKNIVLPPYEEGCFEDPSLGINPDAAFDCSHLPELVTKVGWPGLKDKWPAAYRLVNTFKLTNADQEAMLKAVDSEGQDLDQVVDAWLDANESRWQAWIETARAE